MTCVTQESLGFLQAGSASAAAGPGVRREGDGEREEVVPSFTGGTVETSSCAWVWKGT